MKYNGKEVTSDFISQIMSRAFKNTDEIYPSAKEVYAILRAAEEVFAEMQPKHDIKVGQRAEWNRRQGIICEISKSRKTVRLSLDGGRWKTGNIKIENLKLIEEAQHGEG